MTNSRTIAYAWMIYALFGAMGLAMFQMFILEESQL